MDQKIKTSELLARLRDIYTQREIAAHLDVDSRTIMRWENKSSGPPKYTAPALIQLLDRGIRTDGKEEFTFIDLFAGIGGIRLGFEAQGGKCVFTSEWDKYAQKTYQANFGNDHPIAGDIREVNAHNIPDHDVLLAGFPCQPFSIAGVSKKKSLGRAHGFKDKTQGTLFFDVARIIEAKRPKAFLLENVKNLVSHDKGRTFEVIMKTLTEELGYHVNQYRIVDGQHFTPQHRERILIAGFCEQTAFSWNDMHLPDITHTQPTMKDILHTEDGSEEAEGHFTLGDKALVNEKYILSVKLWQYLKDYKRKHEAKGNGFGFGLVGPDDVSRTLSARYYKDGSEILISRGRKRPRRLTPRECARLMGFDHNDRKFIIPVSDTQAYKQFGNAVVVPVFEEAARIMKPHVMALKEFEEARTDQISLIA